MATYKLNLIPGGAKVVVPVNQYDTGYTINFEIYDGSTAFSLSGSNARIDIGKPDLMVYSSDENVTVNKNTVTVTLSEQMTAMWGPCIAEIVITTPSGRRATANFILDVEKSPMEDGAESDSVINYVEMNRERAIEATEAAENATDAANTAADAALRAAEDALSTVSNLESMPDALRDLVASLAAPGDAVKFLGYNHNRNALAFDAGYVTPQMFGAEGDGTTDDTAAFQAAIAGGNKIVIPEGSYYLTSALWSDDSVVISDKGTYPNKRLVVSRNLRDDAPIERFIGQFNSTVYNLYDYRLQAGCYDSKNDRIVLSFCTAYTTDPVTHETSDTDLVLTAFRLDKGVDFVAAPNDEGLELSVIIHGGGHGNSLCYNPKTNKIYSITGNGDRAHQIAVMDADTLEFESWIAPVTGNSRPWQMAYDEVNDIYWIESNDGNGAAFHAYDANFQLMDKEIPLASNAIKNIAKMHYDSDTLEAQSTTVIDEQIMQVFFSTRSGDTAYGSNGAFMAQYNYKTGAPKKVYRIPGMYVAEEPQCLVNADGRIYLFSDIGKDGYHYVSVSQLVFDDRVSGPSGSPFADARVLATRNWCIDLNDMLGIGFYYSGSGQYSSADGTSHPFANSPYNGAFNLYVLPFAGNESRAQILVGSNADVFVRVYRANLDTWYGWKKITTTTVIGN